jgi:glycosyltransferase involved in cell wall biosynthesis
MTSVLWYSNETPDIHGQGGQRRQYFQIRSLLEAGHDVTVVSLAGDQDDASIRSLTDARRLPGPGRRSRFLPRPRRDDAIGFFDTIRRDRVVIAHIESWVHLRSRRIVLGGPQLLDLHNVFSAWYESQGQRRVAAHWRRLEIAATREVDAVTVCSERERAAFSSSTGADALVVPHGIEPVEWTPEPRPRAQAVMKLFGNWDWAPNRNGLTWFLDQVAPRAGAASGITIEVAGRGTERLSTADDVTFVGRVPDVPTFLADAWVVGLPVMSGVGAPVKFAEALATGVPLVATEDASDGDATTDVLVSDDPAAWARRIAEVVTDPHRFTTASRERRTRVMAERSWDRVTQPLRRWVADG